MRHTRDTRERFADALTTIAGQRLDPWTPTFKTRTLLLRIRENSGAADEQAHPFGNLCRGILVNGTRRIWQDPSPVKLIKAWKVSQSRLKAAKAMRLSC